MSQASGPLSTTIATKRYLRLSLMATVCAALLALAPIGTAGAQDEPAWDAWDQVTGNNGSEYIADSQGRALQLRGVNIKTGNPADGAGSRSKATSIRPTSTTSTP